MTAREVSEVPGLRDAIADEVERNFGFFGNLHGKAIPVDSQTYRDMADVAIAALRTLLTEHPEAIEAFGWERSPKRVEHYDENNNYDPYLAHAPLAFAPPISEERER